MPWIVDQFLSSNVSANEIKVGQYFISQSQRDHPVDFWLRGPRGARYFGRNARHSPLPLPNDAYATESRFNNEDAKEFLIVAPTWIP